MVPDSGCPADQDKRAALADIALALVVDLGHQRTGRVEHRQPARRRLLFHALRHAVGAEDRDRVGRHLGEILHEPRALGFEAFDDVLVVHDLVAHVDGRPIFLQRALDDLNGANHARAKSARLGQDHFHQHLPIRPSI
jgi:hypothetical protein